MNATEDDVTALLREIAQDAPARSTFVIPTGREHRKPLLPLLAAAAVVALSAGVMAVASLHGGGSPSPAAAQQGSAGTRVDASSSTAAPPRSTFTPTAKQRTRLLILARQSAGMNGERHPQVSVVGTTVARLQHTHPSWFSDNAEPYIDTGAERLGPTRRVWIVWMLGDFDHYNPVLVDLYDARTMRGGGGSFDVDTGYGIQPSLMASLGVVVRLS